MGSQLRQILRRLRRTPTFTAVTLLTLAIGIGANTAIFTVVDGVLLRPLPYPDADQLVGIWHHAPGLNLNQLEMAPSNYFTYREEATSFHDVGLYSEDSLSVTGNGEPEKVDGMDVTDGTLALLGVVPMLGRTFSREDDTAGSPKTAVLSYGYWHRRFNDDPQVIGKTLVVDGEARQIIGVLPRGFQFLDFPDRSIFLPFQFDRAKVHLGNFSFAGIGRLKPGVTLAQANADVARLIPRVLSSYEAPPGFSVKIFEDLHLAPWVRPIMVDVVGDVGQTLWVLMAGIGVVLLIACANVANLLLVRADGRKQELAVRAALGASRRRIGGELFFESLVLGTIGAVLGLGVAYGALELLVSLAPEGLPRIGEIHLDGTSLLFTLGVALLSSVLFGCMPIVKVAGKALFASLRDGGRTSSGSRERHRARNTLLVGQVALAFLLLVGSGLMIRTFYTLSRVSPGFSAAPLQTLRIDVTEGSVPSPEKAAQLAAEVLRRVAAVPGVTQAGIIGGIPMSGTNSNDVVSAEDDTSGKLPPLYRFKFCSPEAFGALGIPLRAGRIFDWGEIWNKTPVAVVSENLARERWHDPEAALGKRIRVGTKDDWRTIIGVVGDIHDNGLQQPAPAIVYWPFVLANFESEPLSFRRGVGIVVRSERAGSQVFLADLRKAVWSADQSLPLANVQTMADLVHRSTARTSFTLVMLSLAGGMALLLGAIGLYGVIAYSVSKRTREIGIRLALGARNRTVLGMFLRQALWLTLAGLGVGLVLALVAMRLMASLLFEVSAADPLTYAIVAVALFGTSALASYLPARRAASVDPSIALRSE